MTIEEMEKSLEKEKNKYVKIIGEYLVEEAKQNENLKNKIEASSKTLEGCFDYITAQARKKAVGSCAMVEDSTVYHWAREYFEEDNINCEKKPVKTKTAVEESSEEETPVEPQKEEIDLNKQEAVSNSENEQEVIQEAKPRKTKEKAGKTAQSEQKTLFDFDF